VKELGLFLSPSFDLLLETINIPGFQVMVFVVRSLSIGVVAFGVVVLGGLKFSDFVLSLHGNLAYFLELLSAHFCLFLVLLKGHSVLLEFLLVLLNLLTEVVLHFLDFFARNVILQGRSRLSLLFPQLVIFVPQLFDVGLKLRSHVSSLFVTGHEFSVFLAVLGVFLVNSFVLNSDFFVLIAKHVVLALKLIKLALHFGLFLD